MINYINYEWKTFENNSTILLDKLNSTQTAYENLKIVNMDRVMQQKNKFVTVVQIDISLSKCLKLSREHH